MLFGSCALRVLPWAGRQPLRALCALPVAVHFLERHLFHCLVVVADELLHRAVAPDELRVGAGEGALAVYVQKATQIYDGKIEVTDFLFEVIS